MVDKYILEKILEVKKNCECENWDGYGADPIDLNYLWKLYPLFKSLIAESLDLIPESDGTITLGFYKAEGTLLVNINKEFKGTYSFTDESDSKCGNLYSVQGIQSIINSFYLSF